MIPLCRSLLFFILLKCIFPEMKPFLSWASGSRISSESLCSWKILISVGEGEDVIFPVNNPTNRIFSWRFDSGNFFERFAKTEVGGKIWDIKDRFRGRLSSTENGSLIITNVTMKDPRSYYEWPEEWNDCLQEYSLQIYNNVPENGSGVRNIHGRYHFQKRNPFLIDIHHTYLFQKRNPFLIDIHDKLPPLRYFCSFGIKMSIEEGGEVVLPVVEGKTFLWQFHYRYQKHLFAKTEPGGKVLDIWGPFRGRLSSTENGSLIITKVTMDDPTIYSETLQHPGCVQKYYLRVYKPLEAEEILIHHNITEPLEAEEILIHHNITDISCKDECGPRINVSGAEGGGATLPAILKGQINTIFWVISDGGRLKHFATTKPNKPVEIRDIQYKGRLRSEKPSLI